MHGSQKGIFVYRGFLNADFNRDACPDYISYMYTHILKISVLKMHHRIKKKFDKNPPSHRLLFLKYNR